MVLIKDNSDNINQVILVMTTETRKPYNNCNKHDVEDYLPAVVGQRQPLSESGEGQEIENICTTMHC